MTGRNDLSDSFIHHKVPEEVYCRNVPQRDALP